MTDEHGRYERLAVGHVLGGLDEVDAARFRSHLLDCRECRKRVAELRDIASDLAAAEREERVLAAGRLATETEVERRQAHGADEEQEPVGLAPWSRWPWRVVGLAVAVVAVIGLMVWNLDLRSSNEALLAVTEQRETVLRVLAEGDLAAVTAETGTTGVVAADGTAVAVDLAGVQSLRPSQVLVVWQLDASGAVLDRTPPILASQVEDGRLALAQPRAAGTRSLVVSVETAPLTVEEPTGLTVATATLAP